MVCRIALCARGVSVSRMISPMPYWCRDRPVESLPIFAFEGDDSIVGLQNGNIAEDLGQLRDPVCCRVPLVRIFETPDHAADQFFSVMTFPSLRAVCNSLISL